MFDETKDLPPADDLLKSPSLQRESRTESEEGLKQKWPESENGICDVGFERALANWIIGHRSEWLKKRQSQAQLDRI
jgi:hypothetical protein